MIWFSWATSQSIANALHDSFLTQEADPRHDYFDENETVWPSVKQSSYENKHRNVVIRDKLTANPIGFKTLLFYLT